MTEEYFKYMEELQKKEAEVRLQREKMFSQMQAEYNNLRKDNEHQTKRIVDLQQRNKTLDLQMNQLIQEKERLSHDVAVCRKEVQDTRRALAEEREYKKAGFPYVLVEHKFDESEEHNKKVKKLEDKINELQEKLGKKTVPLSVLAEGLKEYAEEAGINEAHALFNQLNNILISVPAWTDNVPQLKKFFRDYNKNNGKKNITMTGDHATYNEYNDKE